MASARPSGEALGAHISPGFVLALLGTAIWADLKPIYWTLTTIDDLLRVLAGAGREFTEAACFAGGIGLVLLGQSRSFGSIQRALALKKTRRLLMPFWRNGG